ncbi:hypothetical protein [Nocardia otitidiscaviarum]|uniref:hypothetical protein n=1 Tax=Nocardia otitidiscaviarum TaxID=1823 RepID=UPI0004A748FD|nr:hypothetical protein [Nocardia otitidiscaviarum]
MRKWLAGGLIRLSHRIYRPTVTEVDRGVLHQGGRYVYGSSETDGQAFMGAIRSMAEAERRESRGWN